jgi:hypothetical protein
VILARDSDIRMMASSCRTVMGMEERSSLSRSTCWTSFRRETKWEESISDASADKRGAHRLLVSVITPPVGLVLTICRMQCIASSFQYQSLQQPRFHSACSCECS